MKNIYKIIWTDEAVRGLKRTIKQIEIKWSQKEISNFSKLLDKQLEIIQKNPGIFPFSNKAKGVRKCVLSKQTSNYYQVETDSIYLLSVFDNNQDPGKLKFK